MSSGLLYQGYPPKISSAHSPDSVILVIQFNVWGETMINILKEQFYYKNLNAEEFINSITNNSYIELAMSNSPFNIIRDIKENFIILQNQYNSIQFTFSNNLKSQENKVIDIREIENNLKTAVEEQIKEIADDKEPVIYTSYEVNTRFKIETYIVIVRIWRYGFRIYQGMLHSTGGISVKYMNVDSDMFQAMQNLNIKNKATYANR